VTISAAAPPGHYGFRHVARMEWLKLRSLRSTWWVLATTGLGACGIATAVAASAGNASSDLTNNELAGIVPGLLLTGVLGVLVMTNEYSSGLVGTTLVAIPGRPLLMVAKTAVFGALALVGGECAALITFLAGSAATPSALPTPTLGQPGVLRALVTSGAGFALISLMGLGLGAIIRSTPAAITVFVGAVFVAAQVIHTLAQQLTEYLPISILANSLASVRSPGALSPWAGLSLLLVYAAIALTLGAWVLARKDA
jgi:ABC-2 type transport system permease protein